MHGATPPKNTRRSALLLRFVSAGVALPIVMGPVFAGGPWFPLLILGVIAIAIWELAGLTSRAGLGAAWGTSILAAFAFPVGVIVNDPLVTSVLLALAVLGGIGYVMVRTSRPNALQGWALSLALGLYVGLLLTPTIPLRGRPDGLAWVLLILLGTWCCDIAAYVAGRRWGKHPLAPTVSPNKTVEGLVGGVLAAVLIPVAALLWWPQPPFRMLGLGVVIAVGAVFGDLVESAIKRQLNAKDAGWIMLGHGGLLDRIDGVLLAGFLGSLFVAATEGVG